MSRSSPLSALRNFPYFVMMGALWRPMKEHQRSYLIATIMLMCGISAYLFEPYLVGRLINVVQGEFGTDQGLNHALFILFLIFLIEPVGLAFYSPARIMGQQASFYAKQNFIQSLYEKIQALPYVWHQDHHSGQIFDRIRKAESALAGFADNQYRYIGLVMDFLGPIIILTVLFPVFGLCCFLFLVFIAIVIAKFDKKLIALYTITNKFTHSYAGVFSDYVANMRTIITLRLGRSTAAELMHRYQEQRPTYWKNIRLSRFKWGFISFSSMVFKVSMIALALILFNKETAIKIGTVVMLIDYLRTFTNVFYNIGEMYQEIVKYETDYKSVSIINDAYLKYTVGKVDKNVPATTSWNFLDVKDLSFSYNDTENKQRTIEDITFTLSGHEKIALVGPSGAGKSTLMTLLRGLYIPHSGHVVIDGKMYPIDQLSSFTTLIPQDPELFENTIRYNITFGVEHSDLEIMESCRIAGFDQVLSQLPNGLETDIREKGVNLSGGQKQRLALARGVFAIKESSLVLLDEPTSSIDTTTEIRIFERLFNEFHDKAIIASVHRLHLLARFDRIIVMDQGRIVEQGPLNDLIAQDGLFAKIWQEYQDEQNYPI